MALCDQLAGSHLFILDPQPARLITFLLTCSADDSSHQGFVGFKSTGEVVCDLWGDQAAQQRRTECSMATRKVTIAEPPNKTAAADT